MRIRDWSSDVCPSDLLNHYGRRSVPVDATCDTDALPAMTGAVHKLVSSIAPHSDEGVNLSRRELLDAKDDLRAAYDAIGALLTRIEAYERGEAADRKSTRLNSSHSCATRMPSSA